MRNSGLYEVITINIDVYAPDLLGRSTRWRMEESMSILKTAAREGRAIDLRYLLNKEIILLEPEVQKTFLSLNAPIEAREKKCSDITQVTSTLRDELLTKLVSGKLCIKGAERFDERCM